jgi:ketosteroid isomerase-like protein
MSTQQAEEVFNTGDVSKVGEFVGQEYFNHESQADPKRAKLRGPEEVIDTIKNLRSAFADLRYEEQEIIASNDKVVSIAQVSGKHSRKLFWHRSNRTRFLISGGAHFSDRQRQDSGAPGSPG